MNNQRKKEKLSQFIELSTEQALQEHFDILMAESTDEVCIKFFDDGQNIEYHEVKSNRPMHYRSYGIQFKQNIVKEIKEQLNQSQQPLSKVIKFKSLQYGIHQKNLHRWYKCKELRRKQGGRRPAHPEMEEELKKYIEVNPQMKRSKIVQLAREIMARENPIKAEQFNYSKGWYERFRRRLSKKKIQRKINEEKKLCEGQLLEKGEKVKNENSDGNKSVNQNF